MKNGFFEEGDLKDPFGVLKMIIIVISAIILLCSCTSTKPVTATLNGAGSYDPDGYISSWFWRQITTGNSVFITYPTKTITPVVIGKKGRYLFELSVTDNQGAVGKDTTAITY